VHVVGARELRVLAASVFPSSISLMMAAVATPMVTMVSEEPTTYARLEFEQ
jgi:hypothetical protein